MACINLDLTIPTIPDFLLTPPQLVPIFPGLDATFCCTFSINPGLINGAIRIINAAVAGALKALSAGIMAAAMTINELIAVLQYLVNYAKQFAPSCPLEGGGVSIG